MHEPVTLRKMGLSKKFPRLVLYSRRIALGIGLMVPNTIISSLGLKSHVSCNRCESKFSKVIRMNEENARCYYGCLDNVLKVERKHKPKVVTWSNEIQMMLSSRNL